MSTLIFLSAEDREKRKQICESCEFKKSITCGVCGCLLTALQKIKTMSCPKGKWSKEATDPPDIPNTPQGL